MRAVVVNLGALVSVFK